MSELINCPSCDNPTSINAIACPNCGDPVSEDWIKQKSKVKTKLTKKHVLLIIIIFAVIFSFFLSTLDRPTATEKAEKTAQNKIKGFHCLNEWSGAHPDVVKNVEYQMKDPDSFEHIETKITPVDKSGSHQLYMKYRAKNSFGGMVIGLATATITNSDCSAIILSIE